MRIKGKGRAIIKAPWRRCLQESKQRENMEQSKQYRDRRQVRRSEYYKSLSSAHLKYDISHEDPVEPVSSVIVC